MPDMIFRCYKCRCWNYAHVFGDNSAVIISSYLRIRYYYSSNLFFYIFLLFLIEFSYDILDVPNEIVSITFSAPLFLTRFF